MTRNIDIHKYYQERAQRKVNMFLWFMLFIVAISLTSILWLWSEVHRLEHVVRMLKYGAN